MLLDDAQLDAAADDHARHLLERRQPRLFGSILGAALRPTVPGSGGISSQWALAGPCRHAVDLPLVISVIEGVSWRNSLNAVETMRPISGSNPVCGTNSPQYVASRNVDHPYMLWF
jgi:hypothetical protein